MKSWQLELRCCCGHTHSLQYVPNCSLARSRNWRQAEGQNLAYINIRQKRSFDFSQCLHDKHSQGNYYQFLPLGVYILPVCLKIPCVNLEDIRIILQPSPPRTVTENVLFKIRLTCHSITAVLLLFCRGTEARCCVVLLSDVLTGICGFHTVQIKPSNSHFIRNSRCFCRQ
jgi:hypothetical protein